MSNYPTFYAYLQKKILRFQKNSTLVADFVIYAIQNMRDNVLCLNERWIGIYLGAVLGVRSVTLLQIPKPTGNLWQIQRTDYIYNFFVRKYQKVSYFL